MSTYSRPDKSAGFTALTKAMALQKASSTPASPVTDADVQPVMMAAAVTGPDADGSVILGDKENRSSHYLTRYRIDHARARSGADKAVLKEECAPCCTEEAKESHKTWAWTFVKSEAFLFTLHITALALGVIKECINMRALGDDVELAHSIVETFVALLMVTVRLIAAWISYKELKHKAFECESISEDTKLKARGRRVRHFRNVLIAIGVTLMVADTVCFLLFYYLAHLGWTILSNSFVMVVISVLSGLYMTRLATASATIKADQHHAILSESLLLLEECLAARRQGPTEEALAERRAQHFLEAVSGTEFLQRPEHITIAGEQRFQPFDKASKGDDTMI